MSAIDGLLLLRKPPGVTSFRSLDTVKRGVHRSKVGHTGTLDRFADGLLVVLCGAMTRLAPLFTALDKEYVARIAFGAETDTLDPEGAIVRRGPVPEAQSLFDVLPSFTGRLQQVPPAFSAVHVGGKRAYAVARAGGTPAIAQRDIVVHHLSPAAYEKGVLTVRIVCSSGTYVRSLARDIAAACGTCGHVVELTRTAVGPFRIEDAVSADDFDPQRDLRSWTDALAALPQIEVLRIRSPWSAKIRNGSPLSPDWLETPQARDGTAAIFDDHDRFCAMVSRRDGAYRYVFVAAGAPAAEPSRETTAAPSRKSRA